LLTGHRLNSPNQDVSAIRAWDGLFAGEIAGSRIRQIRLRPR
jgi:hypothetical protein